MKSNELTMVLLVTQTTRHLLLLLGPIECGIKSCHFRLEMQRMQNQYHTFLYWLHYCLKMAGLTYPALKFDTMLQLYVKCCNIIITGLHGHKNAPSPQQFSIK